MTQTVLVTGANKGIGFGIATSFVKAGWQVLIGARSAERGEAAVVELGKQAEYVHIDLSDPASLKESAQEISKNYPELSVLINNAGISGSFTGSNAEIPLDILRQTLDVNFLGTYELTCQLLPVIEQNQGRIVNITVPTDANPFWNPLAYKTSKAAQNVMTTSLAVDFEKEQRPVQIFSIHPGPTTTDLNGNREAPGFHSIDEVGAKIYELLADGKNHNGEFLEIFPQLRQ